MADTTIDNLLNPNYLGDKITWCDINFKYDQRLFNQEQAKIEVAKMLGTEEYLFQRIRYVKVFMKLILIN